MLMTRFGISIAFTLCFIITAEFFPAIVSSRVFGICNIFAKLSTIMSPLLAEVTPPVPMVIYVIFCLVTMFAALFLEKKEDIQSNANSRESMEVTSPAKIGLLEEQDNYKRD